MVLGVGAADRRGSHGDGRLQLADADLLSLQTRHEKIGVRRAARDEVGVLPVLGLRVVRIVEVTQQPLAVRRGGAQRHHAAGVVLVDAMREEEDGVVLAPHGRAAAAAARHLVRHADRAVQRRPRVAVDGIEEVELYAGEERPSLFRKRLGIRSAEFFEPRIDVLRQVRIDRPRVGREKVR